MSNRSTSETQQQQTGTSSSSSAPWEPTQPLLSDILGRIGGEGNAAVTGATGTAQDFATQYGPAFRNVAGALLGGGPDRRGNVINTYDVLNAQLTPTISGYYTDPNRNPFFAKTTGDIANTVEQQLRGLYAGAGRDPARAGNYGRTVGEGVAKAVAPIYSDIYGTERARQEQAFRDLASGGGAMTSALAGLDQQQLQNLIAGLGVPGQALSFASTPYNTLLSGLGSLVGLTSPIAGLGGTRQMVGTGTTTGQTESNPSVLSTLAQLFGSAAGSYAGARR